MRFPSPAPRPGLSPGLQSSSRPRLPEVQTRRASRSLARSGATRVRRTGFRARGHDANQFELALRFAAAHIITMASGAVVPVASIGHFVAVVQQLLGVAVNVLVLSAIIAKFQSPTADVVWSSRGVIRDRDGVPTVQFRVGNLRCNKLFPHEISLTLLRRHVTKEGEAYSRRDELEVARPTTISGVHTVAHAVDENSPLYDLLRDGTLEEALGEDDPDGIASPSDATEIRPSEVHVAEREGAERASPSLRREPSSRKRRRRRTLLVHATMRAYACLYAPVAAESGN